MQQSPARLVEMLQDRWQPLETEFHKAYWDSQVDASPENELRRARIELELRQAKGDARALDDVNAALAQEVHDPVVRRQLEVVKLSLTGNQMHEDDRARIVDLSSSVEGDFAAYRPEVEGRQLSDNEIEQLLKTSNDSALRRRAWEASKEIGRAVSGRILELVRLRNKAARDLGFADYYRMSLELQELPEDWLFGVLGELETLTDEPFRRWKSRLDSSLRARFGTDDLRPWHYSDPFFQSLPVDGRVSLDSALADTSATEVAMRTFAPWGIDLSEVMASSDLYPRERKSQHAFCLDVDRSGRDVRILANVVPGERWIEVMLHESGHAAYDVSIDPLLPYLLRRPAQTFVTEAIAILSGRLVRDVTWLSTIAQVHGSEVEEVADDLRRATAAQSLLFARWGLVMTHFERDLYSDPESDLDARWWELVARLQLVSPPPGRSAPDWAAKIHVAVAPVYYHNYLLGELLASQLGQTAESRFGSLVGSPEAGRLLVERVFRPGALRRWDAVVEDATGGPLSAAAFAADLAP